MGGIYVFLTKALGGALERGRKGLLIESGSYCYNYIFSTDKLEIEVFQIETPASSGLSRRSVACRGLEQEAPCSSF
jgi:hypothetical protein